MYSAATATPAATVAPVAVNTAAPALANPAAGLYGIVGASAGTLASSYLSALGQKLAGVSTTAAAPAPAVTDSAASVTAAKTATANAENILANPLVIAVAVALLGLGVVLALRR